MNNYLKKLFILYFFQINSPNYDCVFKFSAQTLTLFSTKTISLPIAPREVFFQSLITSVQNIFKKYCNFNNFNKSILYDIIIDLLDEKYLLYDSNTREFFISDDPQIEVDLTFYIKNFELIKRTNETREEFIERFFKIILGNNNFK